MATIDSKDLSIEEVYKDFYTVPDFQREYVWETENVEQLFNDIIEALYDEAGKPTGSEYFIGSIVVCPNDGVYELIDGQQRMTTLFLLLCAIRDFLKQRNLDAPEALGKMIFDSRFADDGSDIRAARLILQYEDSRGVLQDLAESKPLPEKCETGSIRNLANAYAALLALLSSRFESAPLSARAFFAQTAQRVKLIRIVTPDLSQALRVFETINDRGVGLHAMDLLKNLLFMEATPAEHARLKELWKELIDRLDACSEKHLRFLRYFVMSGYEQYKAPDTNKTLREEDIYPWFKRYSGMLGLDKRPLDFVRLLSKAAEAYEKYAGGRNPSGTPNRYLVNIARASGRSRQHFILMLAGRHLPDEALIELAKELEHLLFAYNITREATKVFETRFAEWSREVSACKSLADVRQFIKARIHPELRQLDRRFTLAFEEFQSSSVPQYRLRYVLAKLAQHVDEIGWQRTIDLGDYLDNSKTEIEHILPARPSTAVRQDFDQPDQMGHFAARLGNLALLEKPLNASIQNDTYAEKAKAYARSRILLTRSLTGAAEFGSNTSLKRAVADLPAHATWQSGDIEARQGSLVRLARQVWGIESAQAAPE